MMVNTQRGVALLVSRIAFAQEANGLVTLPLKSRQVDPSQVRNVFGRAARAEAPGFFNVPATDLIRHNTDLQVSFSPCQPFLLHIILTSGQRYAPISVRTPPQTM